MRFLFILFVLVIFFSCTSENNKYYGQWEVNHDEKLKKVIYFSNDSVIFYRVDITECDTFFHKDMQLKITMSQIENNTYYLTVPVEKDTMIWKVELGNEMSGELCLSDNECISIKKSSHSLIIKPEKRKLRHLSYLIEMEILGTEQDYRKLKEDIALSQAANELILYIDTLKTELMNIYGLNYPDIKCWANLDSLAAYKTASVFMVGDDPASPKDDYLSGVRLENKLLNYFKTLPQSVDVKTIFPFYKDSEFYCYNEEDGFVENWAVNKFFHITLGKTISELNKIQLNIIQLERISKTHN